VYLSSSETFDLWSAAKRQRRVVFALMLHNIRTRFGGHGLGGSRLRNEDGHGTL